MTMEVDVFKDGTLETRKEPISDFLTRFKLADGKYKKAKFLCPKCDREQNINPVIYNRYLNGEMVTHQQSHKCENPNCKFKYTTKSFLGGIEVLYGGIFGHIQQKLPLILE